MRARTWTLGAACAVLLICSPAHASFPGANGKIAFETDRDGGDWEIYVMDPDGGNQTRLTNSAGLDVFPVWSPDGTKIAFVSDRSSQDEIWVMSYLGTNLVQLTTGGGEHPAWSPDGTKIAFDRWTSGAYDVFVMNADGSSQTNLTNQAGNDDLPDWSPNGTKIAFSSVRSGNYEIWAMNANGSSPVNLTNDAGIDTLPSWSPTGSQIAFASDRVGSDYEIYVMNADGSGQTALTANVGTDTDPVWSPDGSRIAFSSDQAGNTDVWAMDADGNNQAALTSSSSADGVPDWRPLVPVLKVVSTTNFGKVEGTGPTERAIAISAPSGGVDVSAISVTAGDPNYALAYEDCTPTLAAGATCHANVTLSVPFTTIGPQAGTLSITHTAPASPRNVTLTGTALLHTLIPNTYDWLATLAGTTHRAKKKFTYTNSSPTAGADINIIDNTNPADFGLVSTTCSGTIPPMGSCEVLMEFHPVTQGTLTTILSVGPNIAYRTVEMGGWGVVYGTVSPSAINFVPTVAGTTKTKTVTFTNASTVLDITGVTPSVTSGADFSINTGATTCSGTLPAGGSCTVAVNFTPSAGGAAASGTLSIASSADNSPRSVTLNGSGTVLATLSRTTVSFADTQVGKLRGPKPIVFTNTNTVASVVVGFVTWSGDTGDFPVTSGDCTGATLTPGASCTVMSAFLPTVAGPRSATLTFYSSATNSPRTVALSGNGY